MLDQRGRTLFDALRALYEEHQYCGELDTGIEGERVWMTCTVVRKFVYVPGQVVSLVVG